MVVYDITFSLHQDFNDIGHYSLWDGNIDQKEIFQNDQFVYNIRGIKGYRNMHRKDKQGFSRKSV